MSGEAYICRIKNVRKHPNADRLQLGDCFGYQVIVGLDTKEDELGVYFPTDLQLSEEFCLANNLLSTVDEQGNKTGGYFDHRRKVSTLKLRGERSEGFWAPIGYLNYISVNNLESHQMLTQLPWQEGQQFNEINGHVICQRYETPQTRKAAQANKQGTPKPRSMWFPEHVDTSQFLVMLDHIPVGARITITEKLHGTSSRFGKAYTQYNLPWHKQWLNKLYPWFPAYGYENTIGTRRVVLNSEKPDYYNDKNFRYNVTRYEGLQDGEIVYGEIVGYTSNGSPIMTPQPTSRMKDKAITKQYGESMEYSYGCVSKPNEEELQQDFYVYRIITKRPDYSKELTHEEMVTRCQELGYKTVPFLNSFIYDGDKEWLKQHVIDLAEGSSVIDSKHIKEGVVLRVEHDSVVNFYKYKSYTFRVLESIIKEDDNYQDTEEVN